MYEYQNGTTFAFYKNWGVVISRSTATLINLHALGSYFPWESVVVLFHNRWWASDTGRMAHNICPRLDGRPIGSQTKEARSVSWLGDCTIGAHSELMDLGDLTNNICEAVEINKSMLHLLGTCLSLCLRRKDANYFKNFLENFCMDKGSLNCLIKTSGRFCCERRNLFVVSQRALLILSMFAPTYLPYKERHCDYIANHQPEPQPMLYDWRL